MNKHLGSNFDDFLEEEGLLEEATAIAVKRVISSQFAQAMKAQKVSKTEMATRMRTSRMVVKRKGADRPTVLSCTLVPYEPGFEMGARLAEAVGAVSLSHRNCANFCVLGGASCSPG